MVVAATAGDAFGNLTIRLEVSDVTAFGGGDGGDEGSDDGIDDE